MTGKARRLDLLAFTSTKSSFVKASPVIGSFPFCSIPSVTTKRAVSRSVLVVLQDRDLPSLVRLLASVQAGEDEGRAVLLTDVLLDQVLFVNVPRFGRDDRYGRWRSRDYNGRGQVRSGRSRGSVAVLTR